MDVTYSLSPDGPRIVAAGIEWSTDMWESSVWARVAEGRLPAGAGQQPADPDAMLGVEAWLGGPVTWGGRTFDAGVWGAFADAVRDGRYTVEELAR